jgi:hypothetical protein
MDFRRGRLTVDDPIFGRLQVEGDGFSAAGELASIVPLTLVQKGAALTAEQSKELTNIVHRYRDALTALYREQDPDLAARAQALRRVSEAEMSEVLGAAAAAIKKLSWRIRNGDALLDEEVCRALGLSEEQRHELARIQAENRQAASGASHDARGARYSTPAAFEAVARSAHAEEDERLLSILSSSQRMAFEALKRPAE